MLHYRMNNSHYELKKLAKESPNLHIQRRSNDTACQWQQQQRTPPYDLTRTTRHPCSHGPQTPASAMADGVE